ncbi:unnamed protein product [Adineta ricciae]|uniref:Uncharacterized protein n=1 Tax=Adineta ricciae TaxID=249248 RepID=A0A814QAN7_ADIRI|nr:unnamed protein product [Adineta ricciae]
MGCAQVTPTISPYNHIPIERLYRNRTYPSQESPVPMVTITVPPVPSYVKGVLKKPYPYGRERPEPLLMMRTKPLIMNRSVNFDEKVSVKPRTPTPDKAWYEKTSPTMPMRLHSPDDGEQEDEEQLDNEQYHLHSQTPSNNNPYRTMSINREASFNINTYTNNHSKNSPLNRIKVRRKLPDLGPPQIIYTPTYQPLSQLSAHPQATAQTSATPAYSMSTQNPNTSLLPTPILTSYQPSLQYSTVPTMQTSSTLSYPTTMSSSSRIPLIPSNPKALIQTSTLLQNQSSIQSSTPASLQTSTTPSYPSSTTYATTPLVASFPSQSSAQSTSQPSEAK